MSVDFNDVTRISVTNAKTLETAMAAVEAIAPPVGYTGYESVSVEVSFFPSGFKVAQRERDAEYTQRETLRQVAVSAALTPQTTTNQVSYR